MKKIKIYSAFIIIFLFGTLSIITVLSGCGKVAQWADPITENILVAMNNSDYKSFSMNFDDTMKAELSEDAFPSLLSAVTGQVGNYIEGSKKIVGVNIKNELITATYNAKFEKSEDVIVEITFKKIDGQIKVVGLWFK